MPFTCICVYDIGAHDADHIAEVACVHRYADDGLTPFRLSVSGGADLALFGSVDPLCSVVFMETLDRIEVTPGRLVRIDLGDVGFIDHSALLVLDEHGMRRGVVFELQRAPPDAERLVRLLELRYVRLPVEPSIHGRQESRMDG